MTSKRWEIGPASPERSSRRSHDLSRKSFERSRSKGDDEYAKTRDIGTSSRTSSIRDISLRSDCKPSMQEGVSLLHKRIEEGESAIQDLENFKINTESLKQDLASLKEIRKNIEPVHTEAQNIIDSFYRPDSANVSDDNNTAWQAKAKKFHDLLDEATEAYTQFDKQLKQKQDELKSQQLAQRKLDKKPSKYASKETKKKEGSGSLSEKFSSLWSKKSDRASS